MEVEKITDKSESQNDASKIKSAIEGDKDAHIALLRDTLGDLRGQNRFVKKVCVMLFCLVVALVGAVIGLHIYDQHKLIKFLNEYDVTITSEITTDNSSENSGAITVTR